MWWRCWTPVMSPGMVTILDFTRGRGSTVGGNHRWLPLTYFRCSHLSLISFFILCLSLFFCQGCRLCFGFVVVIVVLGGFICSKCTIDIVISHFRVQKFSLFKTKLRAKILLKKMIMSFIYVG